MDFLRFFGTSEESKGTRQIEARLFPEDDNEDILGYRFYPLVTMKKSKLYIQKAYQTECMLKATNTLALKEFIDWRTIVLAVY